MSGYPIKDFRKQENYRKLDSIAFWKWEFLRRNEEYQNHIETNQWLRYWREEHLNGNISVEDFNDYSLKEKSRNAELSIKFFGGLLLDPKIDDNYSLVSAPCGIELANIYDYLNKKEEVKLGKRESMPSDTNFLTSILNELTHLQDKGKILVSMDLNIPLDIQIKMIKDLFNQNGIKTYKQSFKNYLPDDWLMYLRIIDGVYEGCTYDEIAGILYPNEKNEYPNFAVNKKIHKAYNRGIALMNDFALGGTEVDEDRGVTKLAFLKKFLS